jgi:hypothetical protein
VGLARGRPQAPSCASMIERQVDSPIPPTNADGFPESVSLNPRWRVADLIGEPFALLGPMRRTKRDRRVARLLEMVQLPTSLANTTSRQLTAGEQKRGYCSGARY